MMNYTLRAAPTAISNEQKNQNGAKAKRIGIVRAPDKEIFFHSRSGANSFAKQIVTINNLNVIQREKLRRKLQATVDFGSDG